VGEDFPPSARWPIPRKKKKKKKEKKGEEKKRTGRINRLDKRDRMREDGQLAHIIMIITIIVHRDKLSKT
jgi:hypothetical protein